MRSRLLFPILLLFTLFCAQREVPHAVTRPAAPPSFPTLARFEPMRVPADNPITPAKVELGRKLFNDPRLSGDGSTACTGCHEPKYGYTVGAAKPIGAFGVAQNRACPSLINAGYAKGYYWENVPIPLEKAIDGVWQFILAPKGEGRPTVEQLAARLNDDPALRRMFADAFHADANRVNVTQALASFVRTLVPMQSAWVRFYDGDAAALSENARRGYEVF